MTTREKLAIMEQVELFNDLQFEKMMAKNRKKEPITKRTDPRWIRKQRLNKIREVLFDSAVEVVSLTIVGLIVVVAIPVIGCCFGG